MLLVDLIGSLELLAGPDTPAGVVGIAEDNEMDMVLLDLLCHVLEVHAPDALAIARKRAMHDAPSGVHDGAGEADVGRIVHEDRIARRAEGFHRGDDAAQDPVLIADVLLREPTDAVPRLLPVDDRLVVLRPGLEVAEGRMLEALRYRIGDAGGGIEVHVCHPHRNGIEPLLRGARSALLPQRIDSDRIKSCTLWQRRVIEFHPAPFIGAAKAASRFCLELLYPKRGFPRLQKPSSSETAAAS